MKNKINKIINEVLLGLLNEMIDPNAGSTYYPPGLDPKVVKLFENVENFYQSTLEDEYWKDISDKFPDYNDPSSEDNKKAVDFIVDSMKLKYPDQDWGAIEATIRSKVHGGIT